MKDHLRAKKTDEVSLDDEGLSDTSRLALEVELANKIYLARFHKRRRNVLPRVLKSLRLSTLIVPEPWRCSSTVRILLPLVIESVDQWLRQRSICRNAKKLVPFIEHCTALLRP